MTLYEKDLRRLGLGYIIDKKIKFQDSTDDEDDLKDTAYTNLEGKDSWFTISKPRSIIIVSEFA